MADQFPVFVQVRKADGSSEKVRVGAAVRDGDGFVISLGELSIGATAMAEAPRRSAPASSGGGGGGGGEVFPPYGRSKGLPIRGASMQDLEFYANGSKRSLGDPGKSRFHDKERVMLASIEAEIARQGGSTGGGAPSGGSGGPPGDGNEPPPHSDDDIPF